MRLSVADEQPQVHQRLALVEMRWGVVDLRRIDLHHFQPRVHQVVGDQLMTAVGTAFEARGEHRMSLEQKVEGVGQCVDVDGTLQVRGEPHEVVRLSEHFLAERQLANDRRWKHGCLSSLVETYDRSTSSISSLPESISSASSASRISSSSVLENPSASEWTVAASILRLSYHQSRCSTPAVRKTRNSIACPRPGIASRTGNAVSESNRTATSSPSGGRSGMVPM